MNVVNTTLNTYQILIGYKWKYIRIHREDQGYHTRNASLIEISKTGRRNANVRVLANRLSSVGHAKRVGKG
jgi:hypothetical protein